MSAAAVFLALWLPGLAIGAAAGLRGWTLAAGAPALTYGAVAVGGVVAGRLGVVWGWWSFGIVVAGLSAVCLAASTLFRRTGAGRSAQAESPRSSVVSPLQHIMVATGVTAGAAVGVITFLLGSGGLQVINQDWDAPFHGNAVRWIAEHGDPTPSALAPIANLAGKADYFYPNTYHAFLALLLDRAGLEMPVLLNLAALTSIVAFPLGVAALGFAWRVPPLIIAVAATISTWFTTFPYDSLWRGPLWPYVAGVALVPATMAITRHLIEPRWFAGIVCAPLAAAGLVGLHTSLAFVLAGYIAVLGVAIALGAEPVRWRAATWSFAGAAVVTGLLVGPVAWPAFAARGVAGARWPEFATPAEAFGQVLLISPNAQYPQWWLGLPALVGMGLLILHRRLLWLVGGFVLFGALYAACASLDTPFVNRITGPFYNDAWRFAVLLSLAGAFAVGQFVFSGARWASATSARLLRMGSSEVFARASLVASAAGLLVVLAVLSNGAYMDRNAARLAQNYHDGPTISSAERAAYDWIAGQHPRGRVMNDFNDGSVWMYALSKLQPVEWTFYGSGDNTKAALLTYHLNELGTNAAVEQALEELDVTYVVIGGGFIRPGQRRAPGLVQLNTVPGLNPVYNNDDVVVYEVVPQAERSDR